MLPDPRIEEQGRIVELALGRTALVTVAIILALAPLTVRSQAVESVKGGHPLGRCPPASGRDLRIATALGVCALVLGETGLDPRINTSLTETALAVTSRGLLTATDQVDRVRVPQLVAELTISLVVLVTARSLVEDFLPPLTVRGQRRKDGEPDESSRRVETVTVSQAPAVSEAPAVATPDAGGAALAALLSAVQDLTKFFLSLSGSPSLGVAGSVAGMATPAAGVGVQLCPSTSAGGAVALGAATAIHAGASGPPPAPAAVPGHQQRQEDSRPSRRHRRSSSDGTDRRSKKRPRERSPSPSPSSCRRERHYRSSSSEGDRAEASPPKAGHAPGGTPGDFRSSPTGDRSPRPGPSGWTSRSSAQAEHYRSGAGRRSPSPSGGADDDRSSAFETVDFDQDDSFRSVLGLIRNFHAMEEPAGTPSTRCKTSLASIYGLMSETSPAFHLPVSPLVRSLLDDTNSALSKFLEDQTVHGFLPVPGRRH